jgi:glycerol-3-phosphate cytidylyltransferase-like family protein
LFQDVLTYFIQVIEYPNILYAHYHLNLYLLLISVGHIQFFREAAQYGDLYVRLGSDSNIKALKNHDTMYNDEERLFMVQNIACVHNASMSVGSGRFDFFEDMKVLRPDVYFVNEDASELETRIQFCKAMKIEVIVHPRKPKEGLAERSSTDMKARMRQYILQEENPQLKGTSINDRVIDEGDGEDSDVSAFHMIFPWRLCFAGGWMDLKWCNELHPGCVVTINIRYHPSIWKDRCGLATSSRRAAIRLWNGVFPRYLEAGEAAKFLYGAENFQHFGKATGEMNDWEKVSYSAGSQDHMGLMFPGITKLNYSGQHWPSSMVNLSDPSDPELAEVFAWLEAVLWVVEIPFVSRPVGYNSQKVSQYIHMRLHAPMHTYMCR